MRITFQIGSSLLQINFFKKPNVPVIGYTSRTLDNYHCLFLDYDSVSRNIVVNDIKNLLFNGYISHAYIFSTHEEVTEEGIIGNYHVISLDKFPYYRIFQLMEATHSDDIHRNLAKITKYRSWVLRFSGKGSRQPPAFKSFLPGFENKHIQSQAHHRLIHILYPDLQEDRHFQWNFDHLRNEIKITSYNTGSKTNLAELEKKEGAN
jgi:hypothetical protein